MTLMAYLSSQASALQVLVYKTPNKIWIRRCQKYSLQKFWIMKNHWILDYSIFVGSFNLGSFVLMAKIGFLFFIVWAWSRVQFVDNAKYSLSSPQSQTNQSKTTILLLMKLGNELTFFNSVSLHARLSRHYQGWSCKKIKMKIIEENCIERAQRKKVSINSRLKVIYIRG